MYILHDLPILMCFYIYIGMAGRARGLPRGLSDSPNAQILRRPGETNVLQRFKCAFPDPTTVKILFVFC